MDERLLKILEEEFQIKDEDIFKINGPLDLTFLMKMYGLSGFDEFKTKPYVPAQVPAMMNDEDIFTQIRQGDILLHHPYMTFYPVVDFVQQRQKTRMYWRLNRPCTVSAEIHRLSKHLRRRQKMENRLRYWWN